jgi:hypothetical protein
MRSDQTRDYVTGLVTLAAVVASLTASCTRCGSSPSGPEAAEPAAACAGETRAFLVANRADYVAAISRARQWLDGLRIDPRELRAQGIKGKKKLTEQLDAYYRLWQIAEPNERQALLRRIEAVVAVTYDGAYHDLLAVNDRQFKQDATSYLRAALLMDRLGLDTVEYRKEIGRIQSRLDAHLSERGAHQRAVFHWYYRHFGLKEPFPLEGALQEGYIAARAQPSDLELIDVYGLTHEIFVPYEYGDRLDADPFDDADKRYLRGTLDRLTARYLERDPDIVAELVCCMRYLEFVDSAYYRQGLAYLLQSQNPDGSWGDLDRAERSLGSYGVPAFILHTTLVAIDALTIAFHEPWNRPLSAACQ